MMFDLPFIWAAIIAFAVLAYVVMDGFDLGIGILFPLYKSEADRDRMMNSVAPVWDGNETWLVLGGGGLFAVFPLAYAVIMPALYAPIIIMLLALVFRGVAFEFRWRTMRGKFLWDWAFASGSIAATFAQGMALGTIVQGIPVADRAYAGGWWNWLTLFSLFTGVALVVGYALLGTTWLILKTDNELQARSYRLALLLGPVMLVIIGLVSLWTPFLEPLYMERWFTWPRMLYTVPVPLLVAGAAFILIRGLLRREERTPFLAALALFVLSYIGIGISFYPYIVPPTLTISDAAAPDESLAFLLVGAVVLVPIILAYTGYAYWVFRGKVGSEGYH
jgi:cytochrome bd ubiquinol oxidase subunit II